MWLKKKSIFSLSMFSASIFFFNIEFSLCCIRLAGLFFSYELIKNFLGPELASNYGVGTDTECRTINLFIYLQKIFSFTYLGLSLKEWTPY